MNADMHALPWIAWFALVAPLLPLATALFLGLCMLLWRAPAERINSRIVSLAFSASMLCTLTVAVYFVAHEDAPIVIPLGTWFSTEGSGFEASLLVDRLSAPMMMLTAALCGLIGRFSSTYLHREPGQPRFYLLLTVFASGMFLLVMAGSLDLLIAGWELVGISSMLLIGFFHERSFPVRNALRAFVTYRACDIGLLLGTVFMHHYQGSGDFTQAFGNDRWPTGDIHFSAGAATLIACCFLWAASGKSALFPVGSWLPRAMEGPTPSSAIFYGALSVHAGAYLMLRTYPVLEHSLAARIAVTTLGVLTAAHGALVARVQTDVKSSLAYATTTQVGVIFAEIGLGFPHLALLHIISHACLRTLQLLRAPNAIQDAMLLRAARGALAKDFEVATATPRQTWLYHLALERFHLDAFWERSVMRSILTLADSAEKLEQRLIALLGGSPEPKARGNKPLEVTEEGRSL